MSRDLAEVDISGRSQANSDDVYLTLLVRQERVEEHELAAHDVAKVRADETLADVFCHGPPSLCESLSSRAWQGTRLGARHVDRDHHEVLESRVVEQPRSPQ